MDTCREKEAGLSLMSNCFYIWSTFFFLYHPVTVNHPVTGSFYKKIIEGKLNVTLINAE